MDTKEIIAMRMYGEGLDNDGQYWSEKDKEQLLERFDEGDGITELAVDLKRSEPAIVQMLKKENRFQFEVTPRNRTSYGNQCLCKKCPDCELCAHSPKNRDKNAVSGTCPKEDGENHV